MKDADASDEKTCEKAKKSKPRCPSRDPLSLSPYGEVSVVWYSQWHLLQSDVSEEESHFVLVKIKNSLTLTSVFLKLPSTPSIEKTHDETTLTLCEYVATVNSTRCQTCFNAADLFHLVFPRFTGSLLSPFVSIIPAPPLRDSLTIYSLLSSSATLETDNSHTGSFLSLLAPSLRVQALTMLPLVVFISFLTIGK